MFYRVSLIGRVVAKGDEIAETHYQVISLGKLLDIGISLHERDKARSGRRKSLVTYRGHHGSRIVCDCSCFAKALG